MSELTLKLDGDALREATVQAMLGVLTPEVKAKMLESAVQATNLPLDRPFTQDDLDACWPYARDYFLQILNGEYDVEVARDDLTGLIGSKYDPRK